MQLNEDVLKQFNIKGKPQILSGGERRAFKVGEFVLKHINRDSKEYANWIADLFNKIKEDGFRVSKPIIATDGKWITDDGWTAWKLLEGNHDFKGRIRESIDAIILFYKAFKDVPKPDFLDKDESPYNRADRYTWGDKPDYVDPQLTELVNALYELRRLVSGLKDQLIHGDLNPDNILLAPNLPPAIIDIAPYWRPAEFALAVYAYWIGPWRNDALVLKYFSGVKEFNQMLVRAGIRMLLIMSEFGKINDFEKYSRATEIIRRYVKEKNTRGVQDFKEEHLF